MPNFETLDDVLGRLPAEQRAQIEGEAEELALAMAAARLKSREGIRSHPLVRAGCPERDAKRPDRHEDKCPLPGGRKHFQPED